MWGLIRRLIQATGFVEVENYLRVLVFKSFGEASPRRFRPTYPDFLPGAPPTPACAAFIKESRMKCANARNPNSKSGVHWGERGDPSFPLRPCFRICLVASSTTAHILQTVVSMMDTCASRFSCPQYCPRKRVDVSTQKPRSDVVDYRPLARPGRAKR